MKARALKLTLMVVRRAWWPLAMGVRTLQALAMLSARTQTLALIKAWASTTKLIHRVYGQ